MSSETKGHLGHVASPSLGHYATLSFVVIGEGIEHRVIWDCGLRIAHGETGNPPGLKTGISGTLI